MQISIIAMRGNPRFGFIGKQGDENAMQMSMPFDCWRFGGRKKGISSSTAV